VKDYATTKRVQMGVGFYTARTSRHAFANYKCPRLLHKPQGKLKRCELLLKVLLVDVVHDNDNGLTAISAQIATESSRKSFWIGFPRCKIVGTLESGLVRIDFS